MWAYNYAQIFSLIRTLRIFEIVETLGNHQLKSYEIEKILVLVQTVSVFAATYIILSELTCNC